MHDHRPPDSRPARWHRPWDGLAEMRPAVARFLARRCRDESEADDLAQEVLLRASRYRSTLADPARLRPWLLRIARNVLHDHVRRERRVPRAILEPEAFDQMEGREGVPGEVRADGHFEIEGSLVETRKALGHLVRARGGLPDTERSLLEAYYGGSGSCAEAAVACEIPRARVKSRLFRARRKLRRAVHAHVRIEGQPGCCGRAEEDFEESGAARAAGGCT